MTRMQTYSYHQTPDTIPCNAAAHAAALDCEYSHRGFAWAPAPSEADLRHRQSVTLHNYLTRAQSRNRKGA